MDNKQKLIAQLHEQADEWLETHYGIDDNKMARAIAEFTYQNRMAMAREIAQARVGRRGFNGAWIFTSVINLLRTGEWRDDTNE